MEDAVLAHHLTGPADATGPTLVLLHAFPLDRRMWQGVADRLPAVRCVLVDLPGCGRSAVPDAEPDVSFSAEGVLEVLRGLGTGPFVVAGVSMGGYVAMALARTQAEAGPVPGGPTLAGLALVDTKAEADAEDARANRLRTAQALEGPEGTRALAALPTTLLGATTVRERGELVAEVAEWVRAADPAGLAWSQRAMAGRPDSRGVLAALSVPATVVVGEEDVPTPPAAAASMAETLADAVLVTVPACGHLSPLEDPDAVAAALRDLLARVGA
ncbi:MAG: alpha/beta hydrolase [Kineosporiaceae bacterium]